MNAHGVTFEERQALLSVRCSWCKASVGEECSPVGHPRRRVTTLAGRAHDARWQAALGVPAPVLSERVAEAQAGA